MVSFFYFLELALPYLALTSGLAFLIRWQRRQPGEAARLRLHALMAAAAVSHAFLAWGIWAIFSSSSSTAAIGLIFLPLYGLGVAVAALPVAWAGFTCAAFFAAARRRFGWPVPRWQQSVAAAAILAATATGGTWGVSRLILLDTAKSAETPIDRLDQIARTAVAGDDLNVLANLARNPLSDERILGAIFDRCMALGPIDGQAPCYQVFVYIAANRNASAEMLILLVEARDPALLTMVGINRNTPPVALERLARSPDASIRGWVAENPALPLPALTVLADDPDELTRDRARGALQRRTTGKAPSP